MVPAKVKTTRNPPNSEADKKLKLLNPADSSLYKRKFQSYDSYSDPIPPKAIARRPSDNFGIVFTQKLFTHPPNRPKQL
ncbi:hypothetical protein CVS40_7853 [Lucilia cuprina]|nr:hypothetical protein CVS40_7853 [Lucilia cuprina]